MPDDMEVSPLPRPPKDRNVEHMPAYTLFKPAGVPARQLAEVLVTIDEFEALRLKDFVGWDQEQCAQSMGVSQSTLQRILTAARAKITQALVEGKAIRIEGGPVSFGPGLRCGVQGGGYGRGRRHGRGGGGHGRGQDSHPKQEQDLASDDSPPLGDEQSGV